MNPCIKEYISNLHNEIERILILQLKKLNVPNDDEIIRRHCFKVEGNPIFDQDLENRPIVKYFFEDILLLSVTRDNLKHSLIFPETYSVDIRNKALRYLNN